uniref:AIG1-type G domain-containing protein n=1 Tax=Nothobranchius furzeri TaxID=105023 RepID=A0A8C6L078_NOTFU
MSSSFTPPFHRSRQQHVTAAARLARLCCCSALPTRREAAGEQLSPTDHISFNSSLPSGLRPNSNQNVLTLTFSNDSSSVCVSVSLRFVLIGNSWSAKCLFGNVLLGQSRFLREEEPESCVSVRGQVKERDLVLINTPNLLLPSTSQNKLTQLIKHCVRLSAPGPHLFLLVLESETFTEEQNVRLRKILEYFSGQSFAHSVVMEPNLRDAGDWVNYMNQRTLEGLVKECRGHFLWKKTTEPSELLHFLEKTVKNNEDQHVSCGPLTSDPSATGKCPRNAKGHQALHYPPSHLHFALSKRVSESTGRMLMSTGPRRVLARPLRPEPSGSEFGQSGLHLYGGP